MKQLKRFISLRINAFNMHIDTGLSYAQCKVMVHLKDIMENTK